MTTSMKVVIDPRKRSSKDGSYPLYLRIIHNKKKADGKINVRKVSETEFDSWHMQTQRFANKSRKDTNKIIELLEDKFDNYLKEHYESLHICTAKEIRDFLLNTNKPSTPSLLKYANDFVQNHIEGDLGLKNGTKRNYRKSLNHLSKFLQYKQQEELPYQRFNKAMALEFIDYLKLEIPVIDKKAMTPVSAKTIVKNIKPKIGRAHV